MNYIDDIRFETKQIQELFAMYFAHEITFDQHQDFLTFTDTESTKPCWMESAA